MTSTEMVSTAGPCRLDRYLAAQDLGLSRARLQRLIREGHVTLNGGAAKASAVVKAGDRVGVRIPPPQPLGLMPEDIPVDIVYEDAHLAVVDKPAGLTVHPAPGHASGTLVNALLWRYPDLPGIGGWQRPGIVHRLDKDTSGLMVVAKTDEAHHCLSEHIQERRIRKGYTALVGGVVADEEGVIDAPIGRDPRHRKRMAVVEGGRPSVTRYAVARRMGRATLVEVFPTTGRTHQIRVHFASLGHPLVGDALYGGRTDVLERQFLHAHLLGFEHPESGEWVEFRSALAADLREALEGVGGKAEMRGELREKSGPPLSRGWGIPAGAARFRENVRAGFKPAPTDDML